MKKYTAADIVDNINARIALDNLMGSDCRQLQRLLDAICRHGSGNESLTYDTECHRNTAARIMENS